MNIETLLPLSTFEKSWETSKSQFEKTLKKTTMFTRRTQVFCLLFLTLYYSYVYWLFFFTKEAREQYHLLMRESMDQTILHLEQKEQENDEIIKRLKNVMNFKEAAARVLTLKNNEIFPNDSKDLEKALDFLNIMLEPLDLNISEKEGGFFEDRFFYMWFNYYRWTLSMPYKPRGSFEIIILQQWLTKKIYRLNTRFLNYWKLYEPEEDDLNQQEPDQTIFDHAFLTFYVILYAANKLTELYTFRHLELHKLILETARQIEQNDGFQIL